METRTFTEDELKDMTSEQFDKLNTFELAWIRKRYPNEYHRLWRKTIQESPAGR